jgi:2-phospho-L-lactate guanylyltransferase (CobY/MobA/RfbA family)
MGSLGVVDLFEQAQLADQANLLLVVDQFEELFRYTMPQSSISHNDGQQRGYQASHGNSFETFVAIDSGELLTHGRHHTRRPGAAEICFRVALSIEPSSASLSAFSSARVRSRGAATRH